MPTKVASCSFIFLGFSAGFNLISTALNSSLCKFICRFTKSILVMAYLLSNSCCIVNTPVALALPSLRDCKGSLLSLFFLGKIIVNSLLVNAPSKLIPAASSIPLPTISVGYSAVPISYFPFLVFCATPLTLIYCSSTPFK